MDRRRQPQVALQLIEHIAQAGWDALTTRHRKSQALGLTLSVVRVLAEYDDAHPIARGQLHGTQQLRRIDRRARGLALTDKGFELATGR